MTSFSALTQRRTPAGRHVASGRHVSALAVMLAAAGCAPPGPRTGVEQLEPLRHARVFGPAGERLSYLASESSGSPPPLRLVLVHGTPGEARGWADYLREPPPGVEVVALDRPGFGQSGPAGAVPSLASQAEAVVSLLPEPPRRALLLGHSLGGPIVARVAAEHPERVAGLILLAAALDPAQERIHPMQRVGAWGPVQALLPRAIRNANVELMGLEPELRALEPLLAQVRSPVLIVHGTQDDLVPVANVPYMQARLGAAACVHTRLLDGLNHFLPWNSEAEVRRAIDDAVALASAGAC